MECGVLIVPLGSLLMVSIFPDRLCISKPWIVWCKSQIVSLAPERYLSVITSYPLATWSDKSIAIANVLNGNRLSRDFYRWTIICTMCKDTEQRSSILLILFFQRVKDKIRRSQFLLFHQVNWEFEIENQWNTRKFRKRLMMTPTVKISGRECKGNCLYYITIHTEVYLRPVYSLRYLFTIYGWWKHK